MRIISAGLTAAVLALTAACGTDGPVTRAKPAASETSTIGYTAASDVDSHAAIGRDAARIRELLATAEEGGQVDWASVRTVFNEGAASKKDDGSFRTLGAMAGEHPATAAVIAAIADGPSDAVRAQQVDKGITVILAEKMVSELAAAAEKVAARELDPNTGAPHNVDEAWAFFTARDQGPALTADKRAKDFKLEGKVREPILAALTAARTAAAGGDPAALKRATSDVRAGLDYVFYLATHKYLDHGGDAVKRAEGTAFYLGIAERVREAAPEADTAILAAFTGGDTAAGRVALHRSEVLNALGVADASRVDR